MSTIQQAISRLQAAQRVLVLSHASPDGDTLGSATALMRGLNALGKQVSFACADPVGAKFQFLFAGLALCDCVPDCIVSVDVVDRRLLGALEATHASKVDLAIDHHGTHVPFAKAQWIDAGAAATTLMIFELLLALSVEITPVIADCIYTGLSTDTGCFRYGNADARAYRAAADLVGFGARSAEINRFMFDTKTRAGMEVERVVLAAMEFSCEGQVSFAFVPHSLVAQAGADESELESIPARVRGIEGVLVGVTLKEKEDGQWKASVRAAGGADASKICQALGGGGHKGAAGCSLGTDFTLAKQRLLAACEAHLETLV